VVVFTTDISMETLEASSSIEDSEGTFLYLKIVALMCIEVVVTTATSEDEQNLKSGDDDNALTETMLGLMVGLPILVLILLVSLSYD
jgi:ABC-type amino acid transport system permease subunit